MRRLWYFLGFLFGATQALPAEVTLPDFVVSSEKATLKAPSIKEASGLAISSRDPGFMWIINDSGSAAEIHLVERGGRERGKIALAQAKNVDWEDLVSFSMDGKAFLLVADTGDNDAKRDHCTLYVLGEPELPLPGENLSGKITAAWKIEFRYEGGPRDCEAVAVDVPQKKVLLLSKRTNPPEIHELPLMPQHALEIPITRKTGFAQVDSPADSLIPFRNQPTGLDISPDNSLAAVLTYYGVFLFPRKAEEDWPQAFARKPAILSPHCLAQAESVAFSKDGDTVIVISEGRNSRIVSYQRKP